MARPRKIKKLSPNDPPERAARRILRARLAEFYSHWSDPDQTPTLEQLHDTRISGKRLRYSAESLREFYPDRLALLIELLKRGQDLLGEIQDCATQREMVRRSLVRMRKDDREIAALERLIAEYDQRQTALLAQFREVWRGMAMREFRRSLKAMIGRTKASNDSA
ncbi:MAG: CHAD domain-containing protein [Blastocatellia bacterium]